jgi:hypothetical protein
MGLLDIIVEELNKQEEEDGREGRWERLHNKPVELVETPHGIRRRDPETGLFIGDEHTALPA